MGIIVAARGRSIWEPSMKVGFCFVDQVRSLETLLKVESGVSPIISDEVEINPVLFEAFVAHCLDRLERTNNGELFALVMGCLQICIALNWKIGGNLPSVSSRLKPLIEGASLIQEANWTITTFESTLEEVNSRVSEVRDTTDWKVYPNRV